MIYISTHNNFNLHNTPTVAHTNGPNILYVHHAISFYFLHLGLMIYWCQLNQNGKQKSIVHSLIISFRF